MLYRALADLVVLVHVAFIAFVVFGGLLALRWRRIPWVHLPAAAWGALIEIRGLICPLTPLENWLRQLAGEAGYSGGFIEHYILPIVYPAGLTPRIQLLLAALVVVANLLAYWFVWHARQPRPRAD